MDVNGAQVCLVYIREKERRRRRASLQLAFSQALAVQHCKSTADYSTGWLSSLSLHARVNKAILGVATQIPVQILSFLPEPFDGHGRRWGGRLHGSGHIQGRRATGPMSVVMVTVQLIGRGQHTSATTICKGSMGPCLKTCLAWKLFPCHFLRNFRWLPTTIHKNHDETTLI